jgi:hypothetical protein
MFPPNKVSVEEPCRKINGYRDMSRSNGLSRAMPEGTLRSLKNGFGIGL